VSSPDESGGRWTLLTGHGHVLVEIARNPMARMRDISAIVGLTERTVQAIVADLEAAGYLTRGRIGRRNRYTINPDSLFRHSAQEGLRVTSATRPTATPADRPWPGPVHGRGSRRPVRLARGRQARAARVPGFARGLDRRVTQDAVSGRGRIA
jgi:hypothetical protein